MHGWMIVSASYSQQGIIRKGEMKMARLTQEQQSNNHFTLESILEEEEDQEEVVEEKKKYTRTTKQSNLSHSISVLKQTTKLMN